MAISAAWIFLADDVQDIQTLSRTPVLSSSFFAPTKAHAATTIVEISKSQLRRPIHVEAFVAALN